MFFCKCSSIFVKYNTSKQIGSYSALQEGLMIAKSDLAEWLCIYAYFLNCDKLLGHCHKILTLSKHNSAAPALKKKNPFHPRHSASSRWHRVSAKGRNGMSVIPSVKPLTASSQLLAWNRAENREHSNCLFLDTFNWKIFHQETKDTFSLICQKCQHPELIYAQSQCGHVQEES